MAQAGTFRLIGKGPIPGSNVTLIGVNVDFANIKKIGHTMTADLSVIEIPVFPASESFCMDTGTMEQYTIAFRRMTPKTVNDSSNDSTLWSNAHFMDKMREYIDRWQIETDGWTIQFTPAPEYAELYPAFTKNAYLNRFDVSYASTTYFDGSLTLIVGSLFMGHAPQLQYSVTYVANGVQTTDGDFTNDSMTIMYPQGSEVQVLDLPDEWALANPGSFFRGWGTDRNANEPIYFPYPDADGRLDVISPLNASITLYATWTKPSNSAVFVIPGNWTWTWTGPGTLSQVVVYLHGAGGGSAGGGKSTGGAGGSAGAFFAYTINNVIPGQSIGGVVGAGGRSGVGVSILGTGDIGKGGNGEATTLIQGNISATGGNGGGQNTPNNNVHEATPGVQATVNGVPTGAFSSGGGSGDGSYYDEVAHDTVLISASDGEPGRPPGGNGGIHHTGGGGGGSFIPANNYGTNGRGGRGAQDHKGQHAQEGTFGSGGGGGADWLKGSQAGGRIGGNGWVVVLW